MTAKLFYIASMGRCGETLLLRCLGAHSKITAVGDGFVELRRDELPTLKPFEGVYVVKQAWQEPGPFGGFILVRQPLAAYRSLCDFRGSGNGVALRLARWLAQVDPAAAPAGDEIDQFCTLYNRRFGPLLVSGLPVVRYEDFVHEPERELRRICAVLGLDFEPAMLDSHQRYERGHVLHAGTRGDLPIHAGSLERWRDLPPEAILRIRAATAEAAAGYGYDLDSIINQGGTA